MFGISGEHLLILGIVLLIFGPRRLPELGNTLGKAIRNFKDSLSGVEEAKFTRIQEETARAAAPHAPNAFEVQPTPESIAAAAAALAGETKPAAATAPAATPDESKKPGGSGNPV